MTKVVKPKTKRPRKRNPNPAPQCSSAGRDLRKSKGKTPSSTAAGRALRMCSLPASSATRAPNAAAIAWAKRLGSGGQKLVTALQNMQKPGFKKQPLMNQQQLISNLNHEMQKSLSKPSRARKYYNVELRPESTRNKRAPTRLKF